MHFLFLEDTYARTTGKVSVREPASGFCEEACSVHLSILTPASSCDFRNSASRSIARSDSDARLARDGPCLNEPERLVVVGSSVLSMSHEALALSLRREPLFALLRLCCGACSSRCRGKSNLRQARLIFGGLSFSTTLQTALTAERFPDGNPI